MSKQPDIRWTKTQQQKLSKNVAKFNAKLTRLANKHPEIAEFLPERLNAREQKEKIKTAKDLTFLVKSVDRFFQPDAIQPIESDTGIKTTKWEVKEIDIKVRRINRQRKKELEFAAPSTERGTMGLVKSNNLQPKKFDIDKIKKSDWNEYVRSVEKQAAASYTNEKAKAYKENYLTAFKNTMSDINGNMSKQAQQLYNMISKLDGETIANAAYNDPVLDLGFMYDPLGNDTILEAAEEHWSYYIESGEILDE
jgi:hypothetical protein